MEAEFNLKAQKRSDVYMVDPELIVVGGLDVQLSPTDPLYDERVFLPIDQDLIASILKSRWIETIEAEMRDGLPYAAHGRSRVRCTREVNKILRKANEEPLAIPMRITRVRGDALAVISLVENAVRREDPPVTLARKIERLKEVRGWTLETIAETLRVTPQSVRNSLSLLKLDKSIAVQVDAGAIGATVGYELAKLPADQQGAALKTMVDARGGASNIRKADAQVAVQNVKALPAPTPTNGAATPPPNGASAAAPATAAAPKAKKGKKRQQSAPTTKYVPPGARDFNALLKGLDEGTLDEDSLPEHVWFMLRIAGGDLGEEVSAWADKHLPEEVWQMIRWMNGELSATRIAGLSQALKIMGRDVG